MSFKEKDYGRIDRRRTTDENHNSFGSGMSRSAIVYYMLLHMRPANSFTHAWNLARVIAVCTRKVRW